MVIVFVGVHSIIATLASATLLTGIVQLISDNKIITGVSENLLAVTNTRLLGLPLLSYYGLGFCFFIWYVLQHTPVGRYLYFVGQGTEVARLAGVNVKAVRVGALDRHCRRGSGCRHPACRRTRLFNAGEWCCMAVAGLCRRLFGATAVVPGRFNAWGSFVAVYFLVTGFTGLQLRGTIELGPGRFLRRFASHRRYVGAPTEGAQSILMRDQRECENASSYFFRRCRGAVVCGTMIMAAAQPATADVSEAKKIVAEAMKPPANFVAARTGVRRQQGGGKDPLVHQLLRTVTSYGDVVGTMQRLVQSYGGKVNIVDGKSNFSEFGRLIEQAVANRADAIVLMGIPPQAFSVQVQQAKDAKIPVIVGSNGVAAIPDMNGVVAAVTIDHVQVGKLLGAWVVADTNGVGQTAVVTHDEVMGTKTIVDSISGEVARLCGSSCSVKAENLPFARIQTEGEVTQSLAARNPDLKYIIPVYDFETLTMAPALQAAGAADRVSLASFNAIPPVMQKLKKGEVAADVGAPNGWFGFAMADQVMRVMSGASPVPDIKVPLRLFTRGNIESIDLGNGEESWYGKVDFPAEYRKLWGSPKS